MTTEQTAVKQGINITEKALEHIRSAMQKEGISAEQGGLRLGVQGGGCSGLSYHIRFDTQPRERDRIFNYGDVRVFVDPKSFIYLNGMTVEWEETLMHRGFFLPEPECEEELRLRQQLLLRAAGMSCFHIYLKRQEGIDLYLLSGRIGVNEPTNTGVKAPPSPKRHLQVIQHRRIRIAAGLAATCAPSISAVSAATCSRRSRPIFFPSSVCPAGWNWMKRDWNASSMR